MSRHEPVGVIRQPFRSGNGGKDGIEFVRCVDGQEPQIHKLWSFAEDGITREVHPFARVDVSNLSGDCFQTYYMTEEACRVTIFGQISINASVEWVDNPAPFYNTTGVPLIENILVPELRWGDGGNYKNWALQTQSGVHFGGRSVPWRGAVPFRPAYFPRSLVNMCATARRVCHIRLRENRLTRAQTLSRSHHTGNDEWGNSSDDNSNGWVDQ